MVNHTELIDILRVKGINARGFGTIPKIVMQDRRISVGAKALYAYLCSFTGSGNTAFPGVKKICLDLCITDKTFRSYRAELEKHGYIEVEQIRGAGGKFNRNIYTIIQFPEDTEPEIKDFSPSGKIYRTVKITARKNLPSGKKYTLKRNIINYKINRYMKYKINNKKEEEEERKSNLKNKLTEITGINFNTQVGRKAIEKWVQGHSEELIFLAAKVAAQYAQKPNIQYIETTLSNWKHQGFKTTEEAKNGIFDPKKREKRHSPKATLWQSEYEIYVPPNSD
jgi:DnaD/phage-associated family protein